MNFRPPDHERTHVRLRLLAVELCKNMFAERMHLIHILGNAIRRWSIPTGHTAA